MATQRTARDGLNDEGHRPVTLADRLKRRVQEVSGRCRLLICVAEGKGGVGKSTASMAAALAARERIGRLIGEHARVVLVDTDHANPMTVHGAEFEVVRCDPATVEGRGALKRVVAEADAVVIDGRGGDAGIYERLVLEELRSLLAADAVTAFARPVTTSVFTQTGIVEQAKRVTAAGAAFLALRMEHSGRQEEHYQEWLGGEERAGLIAAGGREMVVPSLGVTIIDDMVAAGLGFCDVAFQDFSRVDAEIRGEVAKVFDVSRSLVVLDWLQRWIAVFLGEVDAATEAARRPSKAPRAVEV